MDSGFYVRCATAGLYPLHQLLQQKGFLRPKGAQKGNGGPLGRFDSAKFDDVFNHVVVFAAESDKGVNYVSNLYAKWGMKPKANPFQNDGLQIFCAGCRETNLYNECCHAGAAYMILRNGHPVGKPRKRGRPKQIETRKMARNKRARKKAS